MRKKDLIATVAEKTGKNKKDVEMILDALTSVIIETVASGSGVHIPNFGTFSTKTRKGRDYKNPKTGEVITKPSTTTTKFTPAKSFKGFVKSILD